MHGSVDGWVRKKVNQHNLAGLETLEVGSQDVNGSVRGYFKGPYTGLDMEDGSGVDVVAKADAIPFDDESFDCVVTTEMLEHDSDFWDSMREMARVLRPGGWFLLTTRGIGFPHHGYPNDYWRFTTDAIRHLVEMVNLEEIEIVEDDQAGHPGVFCLARKP